MPLGQATSDIKQVFLHEWVLKEKGGVCATVSCITLIGQVSQCSQIMNYDCCTMDFSLWNESVVK